MSWFGKLKISTKFNLILSLLIFSLFLAASFLTFDSQESLITKSAADNARIIARQIIETHLYMSNVVRGEPDNNNNLVPQTVATQIAKRTTEGSSYYVRQVSLRYRNPDNRPDRYETRILREFVGKPGHEVYEVVNSLRGKSFRYMLPMVAEKSCLECHGDYEKAPDYIRSRFPQGHFSYNYREREVIGAVSVIIPIDALYRRMWVNLAFDLCIQVVILFLILSVMAVFVRKTIINPIGFVSATIKDVTRTGDLKKRLPKTTDDEMGELVGAFNKLMEEMGRKPMQSRESDERYRKFIEMARSAVVTFMEDGKIVISNQRAEKLFGLSRQALLGDDIFKFFEDDEALRASLADFYLNKGRDAGLREVTRHTIRDFRGQEVKVDVAISVAWTDNIPMFTAILRRVGGE